MKVGIVGLGIMGTAYGMNFANSGIAFRGTDPSRECRERCANLGGEVYETCGDWLGECDFILICVTESKALDDVATQLGQFTKPGQVVIETGTFSLADKFNAKAKVEVGGATLLDCTVSGTGQQARTADLVFMVSGDDEAVMSATNCLAHIGHTIIPAGEFGNGSKMKYVANHAVAVHNCAAAETLHYANSLGLNASDVYAMLTKGAGQSKMSDLRMPLMMRKEYTPATAHMAMFDKDLSVIGEDIEGRGLHTPLFAASKHLYDQGEESIPRDYDTAAVFEIYEENAKKSG